MGLTRAVIGSSVKLFGAAFLFALAGLSPGANAQCTPSTQYTCDPIYEYISNVQLGAINNPSPCDTPSYEDYTGITTTMPPGMFDTITVTISSPFAGDMCTVWIDWNNNGVFTDAGEAFPLTPNQLGEGEDTFTGTIQVPNDAAVGPKRMRVYLTYLTTPSPCLTNQTYGNIEDYTVTVGSSTSPTDPFGSGTATPSPVFNCPGNSSLLSVVTHGGLNPASTGITVSANLSSVGGSATQTFYDDGTHGDTTAGDGHFSYTLNVGSLPPGAKAIPFTVSDAQGRSNTRTINMNVNGCPTNGPDVYVGELTDVAYFGNVGGTTATGIYAYAVGTDACNAGDLPVGWYDGTNRHPVIAQNMYRLKSGHFEQIGQSWLKHGFESTNSTFCATCQTPPDGPSQLGVGCSDAYGSGLNGEQSFLGPRSQVNATLGAYPWPHGSPTDTSVIGGRLQVHYPDVNPTQNTGARYFAEGHYVTADDATFANAGAGIHGNGLNNATWQEISMSNPAASNIPFLGTAHPMQHGIWAWKTIDSTVTIANADYMDTNITARFYVGAKATNNGDGTWNYEYAVANMNADRSGGTFSVPLPPNAVVTNIGFHDVDSHSGEPYSLVDWTSAVTSSSITWSTQTYAQNVNANALRWGTMYNFRFTANVAPNANGNVTIGLFKPATAQSTDVATSATVPAPTIPHCGSADFNCDGDVGTDQDIEAFFACLSGTCPAAPCTSTADFNADGDVGTDADIEAFFSVLGGGSC